MNVPNIADVVEKLEFDKKKTTPEDKLFIFGRNATLSLAEIGSLYNILGQSFTVKDLSSLGIIISLEKSKVREKQTKIDNNKKQEDHISISQCGSVLKRCQPIGVFKRPINFLEVQETLMDYFENEFIEEKANWGISSYNENITQDHLIMGEIQEIMKKILKKMKIKKAFLVKDQSGNQLSPQKIHRKKILYSGFELVLWFQKNNLVICKTEQVLNVDKFVKRDADRPHKRPLLLLGLALAKTMTNLISIESNHHDRPILDAFCGMGSILQEAKLNGLEIFGSDIDPSCVARTFENLRWLVQRYQLDSVPKENFKVMDIIHPNSYEIKEKNASIVSEPDLLTPLTNYPQQNEAKKIIQDFQENYKGYLSGIKKILPKDSVCVFVFPQIHTYEHSRLSVNIENLLASFGFVICQLNIVNISIPAYFIHNWKEPIIERQIVVFKHK